MNAKTASPQVDASTAAIRIHYIRDYLKWLTSNRLFSMGPKEDTFAALKGSADLVRGVLAELAPVASNRHEVTNRKGLLQNEIDKILAVMDPTSPANPWKGKHTKGRNYLIAKWLVALGIRRGELLNIRIDDINLLQINARLEAETARLKTENTRLLEQFVRWSYNANNRGVGEEVLNRPLPAVNRDSSFRRPALAKPPP
jgi:integrase